MSLKFTWVVDQLSVLPGTQSANMAYYTVEARDAQTEAFLKRKSGAVCLDALKVIKEPVYYVEGDDLPEGVSVGDVKVPGVYEGIENTPAFKPYMDLTEAEVLGWVKSYLGTARIKELEDALVREIQEEAEAAAAPAPVQLPTKPWAEPLPDYVEVPPPVLD